jgi:DNA transformation protein and related proteins
VDPEAIADLFAGVGPVRIRRMFGGQGVYSGNVMFALEADGELYLKTDPETVAAFRSAGSKPFVYEKRGRLTEMSYWRLPEAAADEPDEAARWARLALAAAQRTRSTGRLRGRKA